MRLQSEHNYIDNTIYVYNGIAEFSYTQPFSKFPAVKEKDWSIDKLTVRISAINTIDTAESAAKYGELWSTVHLKGAGAGGTAVGIQTTKPKSITDGITGTSADNNLDSDGYALTIR